MSQGCGSLAPHGAVGRGFGLIPALRGRPPSLRCAPASPHGAQHPREALWCCGYRDKDTLELTITTFYNIFSATIEAAVEGSSEQFRLEMMIPYSRVSTMAIFDPDAFEAFKAGRDEIARDAEHLDDG